MSADAVRRSYDTVATDYAERLGGELAGKPLDRAVLAAFVTHVGPGLIGDAGCGPGHVAAHLAALGAQVVGVDVSPGMLLAARARHPRLPFVAGDLRRLPFGAGIWRGALAAYSIIHLDDDGRRAAFAELARVVAPGGWLLVSFHTGHLTETGPAVHLSDWWGHRVDLDFRLLDPDAVTTDLRATGWTPQARVDREPLPDLEAPTRRTTLLALRAA